MSLSDYFINLINDQTPGEMTFLIVHVSLQKGQLTFTQCTKSATGKIDAGVANKRGFEIQYKGNASLPHPLG